MFFLPGEIPRPRGSALPRLHALLSIKFSLFFSSDSFIQLLRRWPKVSKLCLFWKKSCPRKGPPKAKSRRRSTHPTEWPPSTASVRPFLRPSRSGGRQKREKGGTTVLVLPKTGARIFEWAWQEPFTLVSLPRKQRTGASHHWQRMGVLPLSHPLVRVLVWRRRGGRLVATFTLEPSPQLQRKARRKWPHPFALCVLLHPPRPPPSPHVQAKSHSQKNPHRFFLTCQYDKKCRFFQWFDEPLSTSNAKAWY